MAVTLPVVLLIIDWYPSGRVQSVGAFKKIFLEKMPFFVLSFISSVLTILAQSSGKAIVPLDNNPLALRAAVGVKALVSYLAKIVAPLDLLPFYPYPDSGFPFLTSKYFLLVLLVCGITAACVFFAKAQKLWLAAWLYYVITLFPVLGIIQVGGQAMADRYAYLPTLIFFIIAGSGMTLFFEKADGPGRRRVIVRSSLFVVTGLVFIFLSYSSIRQIRIWKNSIVFWSYLIEKEPQKVTLAYYNRGLAYANDKRLNLSIEDFSAAISINQRFDMAYNNRGAAYFLLGRYDMAFEDFNQAIALNKKNSEAFINRGYLYLKTGNTMLARPDLQAGCNLGNSAGCTALQNL